MTSTMVEYSDRLRKTDWEVKDITFAVASELVKRYHYAHGAANTATVLHGLYRKGIDTPVGVAWWLPPTKSCALATYPENWQGVLSLSRLVVAPDVPKNACSFMLGKSMRMIDRKRWPCFVTYADAWQGHSGTIYKATNWTYAGVTRKEPVFVLNGRMVSRKAGPVTRTHAQMKELGAEIVGRFSKHKFVHVV